MKNNKQTQINVSSAFFVMTLALGSRLKQRLAKVQVDSEA
jgi:hypothetical protein